MVVPLLLAALAVDRASGGPIEFVTRRADGKLAYASERNGDRIPDFSHCGYGGGGKAIPNVPVRIVVPAGKGDATARIQAALDQVAQLPLDARGVRGAVLLLAGCHEVAGCLRITASGVVLRGQGEGKDGTVLRATGRDRRPLIQIAGTGNRKLVGDRHALAEAYVAVGARTLRLKSTQGLKVGDTVLVEHPSTIAWIRALGMDETTFPAAAGWLRWVPGKMDLRWDRTITRVDGHTITLDAPLTTGLDATLSASMVQGYTWPGRLSQVGVENLRCESAFDRGNPHDEEHAWMAVTLDAVENAWVRRLTAVHFVSSAVCLWEGCKAVTVEDCTSLAPVSEQGGQRRRTFQTSGTLTLFLRCRAEHGRHDFAVGHLAAGPNAFVQCSAREASSFSGPIGSWASGVLYDNVTIDGGGLSLTNREIDEHGVGWAAANGVLWQCVAPRITCRRPPTAHNWAIGCWGQFLGNGHWQAQNQSVKPLSLYEAQLEERQGGRGVAVLKPGKIDAEPGKARSVETVATNLPPQAVPLSQPLRLENGWLVTADRLVLGTREGTVWWRGSVLPQRAVEFGSGVTRFVPGRVGPGYTDDLDQLTDTMRSRGQAILEHHHGLWYDRRRDDHQMVRRSDAEVWAPFYELPWARSGKEKAWDGLSRYDLTRYNPWYFERLRQFAGLCERKGLVLLHQAYFQHNILEAGAHWADFPWRPANCLQDTGFPEPPPYVNNKRIFLAREFYDVRHPQRRQLHRAYIRHCLEVLSSSRNVLFSIGEEFTGPLPFVQFWLDTIAEWEKEKGRKVLITLSCTRDVQDAILADPVRGPRVSVIDMKYWWYTVSGGLYAPRGGADLAPRQQLRAWKGSKTRSPASIARQVREYRSRYPDKAVLCAFGPGHGWAIVTAGGSVANLPARTDAGLLRALPTMKPFLSREATAEQWALADPGRSYLVHSQASPTIRLDLSRAPGKYRATWIDPRTGESSAKAQVISGGAPVTFPVQGGGPAVLFVTKMP